MRPAATTTSGILVGLVLFLAMAMIGVIAVNGADNPGVSRSLESAAAGNSAEAPAPEPKRGSFHSLDLDLDGDGELSLAEGGEEQNSEEGFPSPRDDSGDRRLALGEKAS